MQSACLNAWNVRSTKQMLSIMEAHWSYLICHSILPGQTNHCSSPTLSCFHISFPPYMLFLLPRIPPVPTLPSSPLLSVKPQLKCPCTRSLPELLRSGVLYSSWLPLFAHLTFKSDLKHTHTAPPSH